MRPRSALGWSDGALAALLAAEDGTRLSWQDAAACAEVGGDFWFPEVGETTDDARRVCRGCPVRRECLQFAVANGEAHGVWGGLSQEERGHPGPSGDLPGIPAVRRCGKGLHEMTPANRDSSGHCRACKRAAENASRKQARDALGVAA